MDFYPFKLKNIAMPARHISTQSFDEILSDLGDDPAMPDPHGIRKPPPQQSTHAGSPSANNNHPFTAPLKQFQIKNLSQELGGLLIPIGALVTTGIAFFVACSALNDRSQTALEESHIPISELKKEMALMQAEIQQDQDDLYIAIEEIEVSIHSLMNKKTETRAISKPQVPSPEAELRRWRYLGATQMGVSHQAFFFTGKSHIAFEKGAQVLGDWRLSNIEKEIVTLNHPQGKSLALKAAKSE